MPAIASRLVRQGSWRFTTIAAEVAVVAAVVGLVVVEAPGFTSSIGAAFRHLGDPDPTGLALGLPAVVVSFAAQAAVPRWLLARCGVRLPWADAWALALAANGVAVVLPAGAVGSSIWSARQYHRRGAKAAVATWVMIAGGFASCVTVIAVLLAGAVMAGITDEALLLAVAAAFVAGTVALVCGAHAAERLVPSSHEPRHGSRARRVGARLVALASEAAGRRAGWRTGSAVLATCGLNWLADAGCLAAAFVLLRMPVPWRGVLLAYAAGQVAGALLPLPAGLGAVEGGTTGVLVFLGVAAGPALAAVAVYRLLGYWLPAVASAPAYGWVRRTERARRPGHGPPGAPAPTGGRRAPPLVGPLPIVVAPAPGASRAGPAE